MAKKIMLKVVVKKHEVGQVEVTKHQVEAAIATWNSREMTEDRSKWARNRRDTKVFWYGDRCYPPKTIMRIACRKEVEQLAARQENSRVELKLKEGLSKLIGGYQVEETYAGAEALGYRVEGNVNPGRKQEHTPISSNPKTSDLSRPLPGAASVSPDEVAEDVHETLRRKDISSTTKKALIDARVGQGRFRDDVLKLWGNQCAVTGSKQKCAIRASHIKPWRDCETDQERLDPDNGLPLIASLDALFDAGVISFDSCGGMLVSPTLNNTECQIFGLTAQSLRKRPSEKMVKYLALHRKRNRIG